MVVLPTRGDCLPMLLAEAGAAGLPLVSTRVGAIPEIVQPGVTGELVAPGGVDGLTAALERLLTDPELRRVYGANARRLVEREHDARANAARLVEVVHAARAASRDEPAPPSLPRSVEPVAKPRH